MNEKELLEQFDRYIKKVSFRYHNNYKTCYEVEDFEQEIKLQLIIASRSYGDDFNIKIAKSIISRTPILMIRALNKVITNKKATDYQKKFTWNDSVKYNDELHQTSNNIFEYNENIVISNKLLLKNISNLERRILLMIAYGYTMSEIGEKCKIKSKKCDNIIYNIRKYFCGIYPELINKKNKSSKYIGVSYIKKSKRYRASKRTKNKLYFFGYFKNEYDAAKAYDINVVKLFGKSVDTNKSLGLL